MSDRHNPWPGGYPCPSTRYCIVSVRHSKKPILYCSDIKTDFSFCSADLPVFTGSGCFMPSGWYSSSASHVWIIRLFVRATAGRNDFSRNPLPGDGAFDCRYFMCLMAISMISVFSTRPRPFFMYSAGISRDRSAKQLFMRSRRRFSMIRCDIGSWNKYKTSFPSLLSSCYLITVKITRACVYTDIIFFSFFFFFCFSWGTNKGRKKIQKRINVSRL